MGLETVTNIADLVATNPTSSDPKSQGDDHIRNLKTALLHDFAGFTGAVLVTGVDGGVADAYTLTPANAVVAYTSKMLILFIPAATNLTTTPTINISGLGAKSLKDVAGNAPLAGDFVLGRSYLGEYDGTNVRMMSITKNYADQLAMSAALPALALGFLRADGAVAAFTQTHTGYAQNEVKGADIASAATIDLSTATGNFVHITGTTGITAITIPVGAERTVIFDGAVTITAGAALTLPGSVASIVTAANDRMVIRGDTAGAVVIDHIPGPATSAEIKTGTNAVKKIVAANLLSAQGFTAYFQSANQTITDAGALTIAHGLGRQPVLILPFLKNTTGELNYSIGDIVSVTPGAAYAGAQGKGVSITTDATNIYIRFSDGGGGTSTFLINDKTSGAASTATNTKWALVMRAWA